MAKKTKPSAADKLKIADKMHYATTEKYVKVVKSLYDKAVDDLSVLALQVKGITEEEGFSWAKDKSVEKKVDEVIQKLVSRIASVVEAGDRSEWIAACEKSNEFIDSIMKTSKLTKKTLQGYKDRNVEALSAFQERKVEGLGLSDRVWKLVAPMKDEVELAVDTSKKYYKNGINSQKNLTKIERAIGNGTSAAELSRDVRSCLLEPKKLFRRVRDKNGNLVLSKAAKLYHPGQGVYRSSYKNAMRMTRSEINMAYRQSDNLRWQQLDFVVGFKVQLSAMHDDSEGEKTNGHYVDICDKLAGSYPKTFKFVGWHPQCKCFATPILKTLEEIDKEVDDKGRYKEFPSANEVKDVPQNFKDYIVANEERMKGWKSTPYYINDNAQFVDEALHPEKYKVNPLVLSQEEYKRLVDFDMYSFNHPKSGLFKEALDKAKIAMQKGDRDAFDAAMAEMQYRMDKNEASTASKAAKKETVPVEKTVEELIKEVLDADIATFSPEVQKNIRELEALFKQKKGLKMSYEEANRGKENPKFKEKYILDKNGIYTDKDGNRYSLNPEWKKSDYGYTVNCQTCTVVHELRRRGFNVEAIDNNAKKVWKIYEKNGVGSKYEGYRIGKWLKADGTPAKPYYAREWQMKRSGNTSVKSGDVMDFFNEVAPNDGRYEIYVDWKGGSAHVFCAERKNGQWTFFDPQSGKIDVLEGYIKRAKCNTFGIIRVDNKLINPKLFQTFIPIGEIPINVANKQKTKEERIKEAAEKRHASRTPELEKKIRDYASEHLEKNKKMIEEFKKIINDAKNIKDADVSVLSSMLMPESMTSIERMKKEADKISAIINEFNDAMDDAKKISSELAGISGIDVDSVLNANSINDVKEGTKKLEDIKKEILSLSYIDDPMEVARKYGYSEAVGTNAAVKKKIDEIESMTPPPSWSGTKLEYQAKKLKWEAEEYLGTDKYGAQTKYKTWQVSQSAYYKKLEEVNKKIEIEALENIIEEFDKYISNHPGKAGKPSKIEISISSAKHALYSGDIEGAKKLIADAEQTKKTNEASAASKAKQAEAKKKEKQFWNYASSSLNDLKSKIKVGEDGYSYLIELEDAISTNDKDKATKILDYFNPSQFGNDAYSEDRRNAAAWCKHGIDSYKILGPQIAQIWNSLPNEEREALYYYTHTYCNINEPLRGLTYIGSESKRNEGLKMIPRITSAIEKTSLDRDMWFQRGDTMVALKKFGLSNYSTATDDQIKALVGAEGVEGAFWSSGTSKGDGFSSNPVIFNIYAPKGTKAAYLEPISAYGNGACSPNWDAKLTQTSVGGENEILIQRGTKFKIVKVEKSGGKWYIDLYIIEQKLVEFPYVGGYPFK